ncbi:MAG: YcxB family protein [Butyrivibrio sp.]|nr:YcxB family protein [Butyrivibrio sp.]
MDYKFKCDVKASDLWKMAMKRTYKSIVGVVNVVFTVAMIALVIRFWGEASSFMRSVMVIGCLLFPVIQPLATYGKSAKQLEDMPKDMELSFDDMGVHVETGGKSEDIRWKKISNAIKRSNMIIVMSDDRHGYMLTNRVLGDQKESFYQYLCSKIKG